MKFSNPADQLGYIQSEIARLREEEKALKAELIEETGGAGIIEGGLFRVRISESIRKVTDWKGITEKLGASRQIITANTRETDVIRFTVTGLDT